MTIRSTVKKTDRYGIQGNVSFDPTHPNANIPLYRQLKEFLSGVQGLGGSGGILANQVQGSRSYQASHVFNTPAERDAVNKRLQTQMDEYLGAQIGPMAQQANMSLDEYLRSQGIKPISYQTDDFIMASQNPLRGSTEKKVQAFMRMAGNTQFISGGTGENRRHTGYYRPEDYKHVRSMLTTEARKLNEGTANLGDMEGLYLPASQKMEAKGAQNIFKNGLTADLLTNDKHPVVSKIRSEMLKQHAQAQLKTRVKKGLQEEGLLPPDEDDQGKKNKNDKSVAVKAMEATGIVISKIFRVASDLKSLFTAAVGYLQSIASEIGGLKQDSATLSISMNGALQLKNLARMNKVYSTNENVFLDSAKEILNVTADPSRLGGIKWDSAVLQGQAGLIKPVVDAAVSGKIAPVDTMNQIYNQLGSQYFNPKLNKDQRLQLRAKQMLALQSIFGGSAATGYQVATDVSSAYGLINKKNRNNMMGALSNSVNNNQTKATIYEQFGMLRDNTLGSEENQKNLNDFLRVLTSIEDALKKFTMVHMDEITRAMQELALAMLKFIAFFGGKDSAAGKLAATIQRRLNYEGAEDREKLGKNSAVVRLALMKELKAGGYTGDSALEIVNEMANAQDTADIAARLNMRKGSTPTFTKDRIRNLLILGSKYRDLEIEKANYDRTDPSKRTTVNPGNLENIMDKSFDLNTTLRKEDMLPVQPGDKSLLKNLRPPTQNEIYQESQAPFTDEQLRKQHKIRKNGKIYDQLSQLNLTPYMQFTRPNLASASVGSMLDKTLQGEQAVSVVNVVKLQINDKDIMLSRHELSTQDKKEIVYAEHSGSVTV